MELKTHPNMVVFEKTAAKDFPLMLVVGREPNESIPVSPTLGNYDFRQSPNCGLWNTAYRLLARAEKNPKFGTHELKKLCIEKESSPIVIADALPITQKFGAGTTIPELSPDVIEQHVISVLGHHEIIDRVQIVFLSGHELHKRYRFSSSLFKKHLDARGVRWLDTTFFALYYSKIIESEIEDSKWAWSVLREILSEFRNS